MASIALIIMGQPTTSDRWQSMASEKEVVLDERAVQIHPGELLDLIHDTKIKVVMLDVRDEANFNLFHILDARHVPLADMSDVIPELHFEPANAVFVLMTLTRAYQGPACRRYHGRCRTPRVGTA